MYSTVPQLRKRNDRKPALEIALFSVAKIENGAAGDLTVFKKAEELREPACSIVVDILHVGEDTSEEEQQWERMLHKRCWRAVHGICMAASELGTSWRGPLGGLRFTYAGKWFPPHAQFHLRF